MKKGRKKMRKNYFKKCKKGEKEISTKKNLFGKGENKASGITLIALIITVIVILILARSYN